MVRWLRYVGLHVVSNEVLLHFCLHGKLVEGFEYAEQWAQAFACSYLRVGRTTPEPYRLTSSRYKFISRCLHYHIEKKNRSWNKNRYRSSIDYLKNCDPWSSINPEGGHSTFFQVGVCSPDFRSVGLANWYLPLKRGACELKMSQFWGLWAENFQIWKRISTFKLDYLIYGLYLYGLLALTPKDLYRAFNARNVGLYKMSFNARNVGLYKMSLHINAALLYVFSLDEVTEETLWHSIHSH